MRSHLCCALAGSGLVWRCTQLKLTLWLIYSFDDYVHRRIRFPQQELEKFYIPLTLDQTVSFWYIGKGNSTQLAHYFRVLYRILEYIDTAKIDDKKLYIKILRAQLSEQELVILFYNSFIPEGEKMRKHIEKYALLKHMNDNNLVQQRDKNFYNSSAYDDNQT